MQITNINQEPKSYESALAELQELLSLLEQPQTPLDSLTIYTQRIAFLLQYCKQRLRQIETEIQKTL